jgi:predicted AAA+ superfamily ATPase
MDVKGINQALAAGRLDEPGLFPHLDELRGSAHVFPFDFGLGDLPREPGVLLIRGARQYGKSTWLEGELRRSVETFGPGSAYYLNGDEITDVGALAESIRVLLASFSRRARARRLFIDEITAVPDWESALKRLCDAGELRDVLVVTTGSRARDLRRGSERLPGRKGRLRRTHYIFTPVSYSAFRKACAERLGAKALPAYLLSGGSPAALSELAAEGRLPEHRIETARDWIYGECAASGRPRSSLLAVLEYLIRHGGSPIGQAGLARDTGLANNTVAAGYIELLGDLLCVGQAAAWDASRRVRLARKPCKFPFINLLAAAAWHPARPRSIADFARLPDPEQAMFMEWGVAQELWRRRAKNGDDLPELLSFWQSKEHELDYVLGPDEFLEVKRGAATPLEFAWFGRTFPRGKLKVINAARFESDRVKGLSLEEFLLEQP